MNAKPERNILSPCSYKGSYGKDRYPGRYYEGDSGTYRVIKGCELVSNYSSCANAIQKIPQISCIRPCQEYFLKPTSKGVKEHKKKSKSKFKGCQVIENDLLEEKLINYFAPDITPHMRQWSDIITSEKYDQYFNLEAFYEEIHCFHFRVNYVLLKQEFAGISYSPENIKGVILRDLLLTPINSLKPSFEELQRKATLFIITMGLSNINKFKDLIINIFPDYEIEKFSSIQSSIFVEIKKKTPQKLTDIQLAYDSLSKAQKQAVDLIITKREFGVFNTEIAEDLGISQESLQERLIWAKRKIIKAMENHYGDKKITDLLKKNKC
jgi:hypothetical protein